MGAQLADAFASARDVFAEVDEALGQKLSVLMREGPEDQLTLTENAQPALMAVSVAVIRALKVEFDFDVAKAAYVAGHSLGEYSALAAAGAISLSDTARLLKLRGQAMQRAVPVGQGAMASLIGPKTDLALAEAAAAAGAEVGVCVVANDNNAGNIVISGEKAAVDRAIEKAKELGARAIPLNVSAPFHCPLMQPAADEMATALASATILAPAVPVVANVLARPESDPEVIRRLLVEQVTGRVRWRESMEWMASEGRVTRFVEVGSGKVLTGMAKRIAPDAESLPLNTPEELEAFARGVTSKTALVTGATGGIGGAVARALHAQGATVVLSGTREAVLADLAKDLGERAHFATANLSDPDSVDNLVNAAETAAGSALDILVANAGITKDGLLMRMKDEDFQSVIQINLESYFRLTRAAVKGMMKRRSGRIIGVTSVVGVTGNPGQTNYSASKAGMIGFSKSLAQEVGSRGITVNCIAPGFIASPMTDVLNDQQRETILGRIPAGRLGTGDEIAAAAVYLSSDEAAYVTGQTLHVNGGMAMI
ncbi:hypothetical protein LTR94_021348 [Friedmanniomyces endolithicus]|nr:hypothetical protein LTR94_021348 [Friedmanniomyces endolithicus]